MSTLILLCGIPGSGKTTIAKKIMQKNDLYISRDEIRYSMISNEDEYFAKEKEVFKEYIRQIDEALTKNYHWVFADATHLNKASRNKVINRLQNKPDKINVIYMTTSLKEALRRNSKRTGRALVPENVIKEMYNSLEKPTKEENINKIFYSNGEDIIYE